MTQKEFTLLNMIRKHGMQSCRWLKEKTQLSVGYISQTMNVFQENGWIGPAGITDAGMQELKPYEVESAVIMAAGMSSRFIPISLEKPKGLLTVKGEVLIERQIRQLKEAGIRKIVLVLGYKKEAFFYLEDKFEDIVIVVNPKYDTRNNTFTLYLAQQYIGNTYICSSDNYFTENPFEPYVYRSYYSAVEVDRKMNEWYMIPDSRMNISRIIRNHDSGYIMMGHVYWDRSFSSAMLEMINRDQTIGEYDTALWEQILADHLKKLPPMEIRVYPENVIHEFDSLDELREFDSQYVSRTNSRIMQNIIGILNCKEEEIRDFRIIKKGLSNTSFCFEVGQKKYVFRYPEGGEGRMVNHSHEKRAQELAKTIGADPTYLYLDETEGWKISRYVENGRKPDFGRAEDIRSIAAALRALHGQKMTVGWNFLPWERTQNMELLLRSEKDGISDPGFDALEEGVRRVYTACAEDGTEKCFCHCDPNDSNWIMAEGKAILIDWEYAGNADPGCDVGSFILNSGWKPEEAKGFIREYCGGKATDTQERHYLAYTAVMAFYWYVWALLQEANGVIMGEGIYQWRRTARDYSRYLAEQYGL